MILRIQFLLIYNRKRVSYCLDEPERNVSPVCAGNCVHTYRHMHKSNNRALLIWYKININNIEFNRLY